MFGSSKLIVAAAELVRVHAITQERLVEKYDDEVAFYMFPDVGC